MTAQDAPRYLTVLADYICNTGLGDFPQAVVARARWLIADTLPLIAAGMKVGEMQQLAAKQLAANPHGDATVIGLERRTSANVAALLNGTAGTWLEFVEENIYAKGLPSSQIMPAALAVAEERRACGRELLEAFILGYEASCRISRATKTKLAIHPSGTFGVIGAAVAAGRLAGLGRDAMRDLLNVSATLGLATSRNAIIEGATVGRAYSGASGYLGILALELVQSEFTGERDGVQSVYGSVYADTPDVKSRIPQGPKQSFEPDMVIDGLGSEFLITQGFIKMHACARSIHPALDVIEAVMSQRKLDPRDIERIDFLTYVSPTTLHNKTPATPFGSKFSLPFAVASLIYHGRPSLANFEERAFENPVIRELALKVNVAENPDYTANFPHRQPCDVKVLLKDGTMLTASATYTKGDPKNPRSEGELTAKFFDVCQRVWSDAQAKAVLEEVMSLEETADMHAFFRKHAL
jgi:2-methylcitrate dehydratase PrpD